MRLIFSFSFRNGLLNSQSSYTIHPKLQTSLFISYPSPCRSYTNKKKKDIIFYCNISGITIIPLDSYTTVCLLSSRLQWSQKKTPCQDLSLLFSGNHLWIWKYSLVLNHDAWSVSRACGSVLKLSTACTPRHEFLQMELLQLATFL